jgi:ribose transport system ATP-binding protein
VRALSGGNQQKVVLGRWLLSRPKIFILDEPTRGVDVSAKQDIYRLLSEMGEAGMAILVISSELEELLGLCDRILVMRRGELQATFDRVQFDREAILRAAFGQGEAA